MRPEDFARDRRVVDGLGRLHLLRRDDDVVDENAGHMHLLRLQAIPLCAMRLTWAITMPPLLRTASAWSSGPR